MKKLAIVAAVLVCTLAQAQEAALTPADTTTPDVAGSQTRRLNRITVGPLGLLFGSLPFEYERAITDKLSVAIGPQLQFGGGSSATQGDVSVFGFGSTLALRAFPLEGSRALEGLWVGPELQGAVATATSQGGSATAVGFGVLGTVGYTFIASGGFSASFGGGAGFKYVTGGATIGQTTATVADFSPALSLHAQLGYAF